MKYPCPVLCVLLTFTSLGAAADLSEDLVLHYDFEDVTASTIKNLAGQGLGTVMGGDPRAVQVAEDSPLIGKSALFCDTTRRGTQATYVDSGQGTSQLGVRNRPYTMMAWVKPLAHPRPTRGSDVEVVFGQETNPPLAFNLSLGTNSRNQMRAMHGGWDTGQSSGSSVVERNVWQHLAWVHDDGQFTFYKDGEVFDENQTTFPVTPLVHGADLIIGLTSASSEASLNDRFSFSGFIDDTRIYKRVLTQDEIQAVKQSGTAPLDPPRLDISKTVAGPQLRWSGLRPNTFLIESSTDLRNWEPITDEQPPIAGQLGIDAIGDHRLARKRYYRLGSQNRAVPLGFD